MSRPLDSEVEGEVEAAVEQGAASDADIRSIARGGALNLVGAAGSGLLSFILVVVVTRQFGAGRGGAFFEAVAFFTILTNAAELGADTGLLRAIPRHLAHRRPRAVRNDLRVALLPAAGVGAVAALACFLLARPISRAVGDAAHASDIEHYIRILMPFVPLSVLMTVGLAATRGFGTMRANVLYDRLGRTGAQPLFVWLAGATGAGSTALGLAYGLPFGLACIPALLVLRKLVRAAEHEVDINPDGEWEVDDRSTKAAAKEFWGFSAPRALSGLFQIGIDKLDVLLVGGLASSAAAGIYTAATRYLIAGAFASTAVMQAMQPRIASLIATREHRRANGVYQTATAWTVLLTWPMYLTLAVMAPTLLRVFGKDFADGRTALLILAVTMLIPTAVGPAEVVLLMGGRSKWALLNTAVALAANVGLNLVLIPRWGINGAAFAWSVSLMINNIAPLAQVWHFQRLHPFGKGFLPSCGAALASFGGVGLVVRAVMGEDITALIAYLAIAGGLYVAALYLLRQPLDLASFSGIFRRPGKKKATAPTPPTAGVPGTSAHSTASQSA